MQHLYKIVISLTAIVPTIPGSLLTIHSVFEEVHLFNVFHKMLMDIMEERQFETMLVTMHRLTYSEPRLDVIYRFKVPKLIKTPDYPLNVVQQFNAEMLVVILMSHSFEEELLTSTSQSIDYRRQSRILIIAWNVVKSYKEFQNDLLKSCQRNKMTNVLLSFGHSTGEMLSMYYKLQPYPQYHWSWGNVNESKGEYFTEHWRNMHNKTIITYTDQTAPRAVVYKDEEGNVQINGFVARLVLLFAEYYNASLEMCCPLKVGELSNFNIVNKMVDDNLLDIPMTTDPVLGAPWGPRSAVYDIGSAFLILPCAKPKTIREIYRDLLGGYLYGFIFFCTWVLSILHSLIDLGFEGQLQYSNFFVSERILPGVLGQSFKAKEAICYALNIVYLLVFFAGLNVSTLLSSNVNTFLTSPPHHPPIRTFDDINRRSQKILVDAADSQITNGILDPIGSNMVLTNNSSYYQSTRRNFNTSVGYPINSAAWGILVRNQDYFSRKLFCTYDSVMLYPFVHFAIRLQLYSEYKEPLDYLIHLVQAMGFTEAWYTSTFLDLMKMDQILTIDPNPLKEAKVLTVSDLYSVWINLAVGLTISAVVFLLELCRKQLVWLLFVRGNCCSENKKS